MPNMKDGEVLGVQLVNMVSIYLKVASPFLRYIMANQRLPAWNMHDGFVAACMHNFIGWTKENLLPLIASR